MNVLTFNLEDKKAYKWSFDVLKMYATRFQKIIKWLSKQTLKQDNQNRMQNKNYTCRRQENNQKLKQKEIRFDTPLDSIFSSSRWNQYGGGGGRSGNSGRIKGK